METHSHADTGKGLHTFNADIHDQSSLSFLLTTNSGHVGYEETGLLLQTIME